jgi:hypothetical protein
MAHNDNAKIAKTSLRICASFLFVGRRTSDKFGLLKNKKSRTR